MNQQQFNRLAAQGHSHIPVVREVLADLETPLSTYLKLANAPLTYLFEPAAQGGEKWGRYSIIGLPAHTVLRVQGNRFTVQEGGNLVEERETDDPLAAIESFLGRFKVPNLPGLPRFFGGLVGYLGYDTIRYVEQRLADRAPPDDMGTPDILLMLSEDVVVFDNLTSRMTLVTLAPAAQPSALANAETRVWPPGRNGLPPPRRRWPQAQAPSPPMRTTSHPCSARRSS